MDQHLHDVVIVGAGVSGLTCARELRRRGHDVLVLESGETIGGRVRTDIVEGFRLDHGFQVLLTAYPEVRREIDLDALDVRAFEPGAVIRSKGEFHHVSDPLRNPSSALKTLAAPVGGLIDKLRLLAMVHDVRSGAVSDLWARPASSSMARLRDKGFSEQFIATMLKPLYSGIFLESDLLTSSRKLEFIMRMQAAGDVGLPSGGMSAVIAQLADSIPTENIRLRARATVVGSDAVTLDGGTRIRARAIVVATDERTARTLLPSAASSLPTISTPTPAASLSCTTLYYAMQTPPHASPVLILNGDGSGPVNNACVLTNVQPSYAPEGLSLLQATHIGTPVVDDTAFESMVRAQLTEWFGAPVQSWRHLRTYRIDHALPFHAAGVDITPRTVKTSDSTWACGDYLGGGTLNGAMASGRAAGVTVAEHLGALMASA